MEEEAAESNDNLQAPAILNHARTLPQREGRAGPAFAGRAEGSEDRGLPATNNKT
jgi:hypothetical protein